MGTFYSAHSTLKKLTHLIAILIIVKVLDSKELYLTTPKL